MNPAIELSPPDISPWQNGNTGVPWVHRFEGAPGRASPQNSGAKVLVQALTHGNEICGAIALHWLLGEIVAQRWAPYRGTLTLAFANVQAYQSFNPAQPFASRYVDEDLNRVWTDERLGRAPDALKDSAELRRARALQPFVDAADYVLDIHSMSEPCAPLMVCGTADKNAHFAKAMGMPEVLLVDTGHPGGLRMVERGGLGDPRSPRRALLIECGQHWERASADVAIDSLVRFLGLVGMATQAWVDAHTRLALPKRQRLVRVTEAVVARSDQFKFLRPTRGLDVIEKAGTPLAQDGNHVWHTPYDNTVLVMPGTNNLLPGGTAVRLGRYEDI